MIVVPFAAPRADLVARVAPDRRMRRHAVRVVGAALAQIADWPVGATWVTDGLVECVRGQLVGTRFVPDPLGTDVCVCGPLQWVWIGAFLPA